MVTSGPLSRIALPDTSGSDIPTGCPDFAEQSMIHLHGPVHLDEDEVVFSMIRAQGAGGQNVNKVSSAVHLRFDIGASSLPPDWQARLLTLNDRRITGDGVVVIKAQSFRTQERNRMDALERLAELLRSVAVLPTVRRPTKPTRSSQRRRLDGKAQRGAVKRMRGSVQEG